MVFFFRGSHYEIETLLQGVVIILGVERWFFSPSWKYIIKLYYISRAVAHF